MPRLLLPTLVTAGVAVVSMLLFDAAVTRVVGVLAIFAFIALGAFMIASPDYLSADDDDS